MAASRGLGKGLDALFQKTSTGHQESQPDGDFKLLALDSIDANPHQPRKQLSQESLEELAQSIRHQGLLQPILVRPHDRNAGRYQIVAGERRWRACKLAELQEIPAIVTRISDAESLVIGLIENLQREDLNPMEEAGALHTLIRDLEISQEALSEKIGKSRSSIANSLRLLQLDEDIQKDLREGRVTAGQARSLLAVTDSEARRHLYLRTVQEQLTVREIERLVSFWKENGTFPDAQSPARKPGTKKAADSLSQAFARYKRQVQKELASRFEARVRISGQKDKGSISFKYRSEDELRSILARMGVDENAVSRETS